MMGKNSKLKKKKKLMIWKSHLNAVAAQYRSDAQRDGQDGPTVGVC